MNNEEEPIKQSTKINKKITMKGQSVRQAKRQDLSVGILEA